MTRDEAIEYLKGMSEDEPVFVLRAQDKVAPATVLTWALMAELVGAPREKCWGATSQARAMEDWRENNSDKVKVPD